MSADLIMEETINQLKDSGFKAFELTTYTLVPEGTMDQKQKAVYELVYNSKTIEELGQIRISADLSEYAVDGAVASGDFNKFKFVLENFPFKHNYSYHVVSDVIHTAARTHVSEGNLLKVVEYLIEHKAPGDKYLISSAANSGYYQIAEYLLNHNSEMMPLNRFNFYKLDNKTKLFDSFKWQYEHGAKIEPGLVSKIICNNRFEHKFDQHGAFDNEENIYDAIDFLIEIGITDQDKVTEIKQQCGLISELHSYRNFDRQSFLMESIQKRDSIQKIKFLVDNGVLDSRRTDFGDLATQEQNSIAGEVSLKLINHPNTELVHYLVDEMKAKGMIITKAGGDNYPNYIMHAITKNMHNCEGNKLIADYAGVTSSIDWSSCETEL